MCRISLFGSTSIRMEGPDATCKKCFPVTGGSNLWPPGIDRIITIHRCQFLPRSETHAVQAARTLGRC
jgi:hypothetical protein